MTSDQIKTICRYLEADRLRITFIDVYDPSMSMGWNFGRHIHAYLSDGDNKFWWDQRGNCDWDHTRISEQFKILINKGFL